MEIAKIRGNTIGWIGLIAGIVLASVGEFVKFDSSDDDKKISKRDWYNIIGWSLITIFLGVLGFTHHKEFNQKKSKTFSYLFAFLGVASFISYVVLSYIPKYEDANKEPIIGFNIPPLLYSSILFLFTSVISLKSQCNDAIQRATDEGTRSLQRANFDLGTAK